MCTLEFQASEQTDILMYVNVCMYYYYYDIMMRLRRLADR